MSRKKEKQKPVARPETNEVALATADPDIFLGWGDLLENPWEDGGAIDYGDKLDCKSTQTCPEYTTPSGD